VENCANLSAKVLIVGQAGWLPTLKIVEELLRSFSMRVTLAYKISMSVCSLDGSPAALTSGQARRVASAERVERRHHAHIGQHIH
jgi:hypothetical protein